MTSPRVRMSLPLSPSRPSCLIIDSNNTTSGFVKIVSILSSPRNRNSIKSDEHTIKSDQTQTNTLTQKEQSNKDKDRIDGIDGVEHTQVPPQDLGGKTRSRQGSVTFQDPELVVPIGMDSSVSLVVHPDRLELEEALKRASAEG